MFDQYIIADHVGRGDKQTSSMVCAAMHAGHDCLEYLHTGGATQVFLQEIQSATKSLIRCG